MIAALFALVVGLTFGLIVGLRHAGRDADMAYLYGHVDGYGKALDDCGEVPL
jgi:hypothetical protein